MKKRKIDWSDARIVYAFVLFTWALICSDMIAIHDLARERIKSPTAMELAFNAFVDDVNNDFDLLEEKYDALTKGFGFLYHEMKSHKCSLHYGRENESVGCP